MFLSILSDAPIRNEINSESFEIFWIEKHFEFNLGAKKVQKT